MLQHFVGDFFEKLIGTRYVRDMIEMGYRAEEIESMWRADVERFVEQRKPYLIYEE